MMTGVVFFSAPDADASGVHALPSRVRVLLMRLTPYMEKQDYPGAIQFIKGVQARKALPEPAGMFRSVYHHPELYFVLGNCYLLEGEYGDAVAAYEKTVAGDPAHTYGWLNLAKAHYERKEYLQAGNCFGKGYQGAREKDPETLYYSAASYLMAEKYGLANVRFSHLQKEHPQDFKAEWKEYWVHSLLGVDRVEDAISIMRELIAVYDGNKRLQWQENLLHQYMQRDDSTMALQYITELTEEGPQVAKWWKAAAHIELAGNRYEKGLAALIIYSFLTPWMQKKNNCWLISSCRPVSR